MAKINQKFLELRKRIHLSYISLKTKLYVYLERLSHINIDVFIVYMALLWIYRVTNIWTAIYLFIGTFGMYYTYRILYADIFALVNRK